MLQLSRKEAVVYENLVAGALPRDISIKLGVHRITVMYFINKLVNLGLAEKSGRINGCISYRVLPKPFEIVARKKSSVLQEFPKFELTEDQLFYLRNHHSIVKRTTLAKRLNISKLQLNFAVLMLGCTSPDDKLGSLHLITGQND